MPDIMSKNWGFTTRKHQPQPLNSAITLKQLGDSGNTLNHLFSFDGDPISKI